MKNLIKKWLGIEDLEEELHYLLKLIIAEETCRRKEFADYEIKMAQKYNRGMIKSLIEKVLATQNKNE